MCSVSFAVGRWRGRHGKSRVVALAATICPASYDEGFDLGASERAQAPRRTAQPARGRFADSGRRDFARR
ncbi:hypothetical protein [Methylobacterium haplocladii]|uniref:Uncharacterized protein n=1 Tax=Methylobacterium haplocladii TaxID=1176176 RepID=A0A512IS45_9HYPH|nr:hypothetical protein [Methylobacterium haplocladii]GEP00528.1 hypothetical protein MHA02_29150 [Methylobacterium haplocladii]GJD85443.1 hypothetical protein HPGCJGGD_3332 [Methylobacterium haplocladii]GLS57828.1 hypothetical protein GCM10007887_04840 [Methylobacterium haplocladii]